MRISTESTATRFPGLFPIEFSFAFLRVSPSLLLSPRLTFGLPTFPIYLARGLIPDEDEREPY